MAGSSYSHLSPGDAPPTRHDDKIMKLVRKLDDTSYPYEMFQLPYTLGDNGPPDPTLSDFVRQWNDRYATPRLILATHEQMFEEFEKRYGSTLPVVQGDFTPYWEDGAASTAAETALSRAAADRLIQGEALWSMLSPALYPTAVYESAWRDIVLYDEHTWGAYNSTEAPDLPFVKEQWQFKQKFALDADRASRELLAKARYTRPLNPPQRPHRNLQHEFVAALGRHLPFARTECGGQSRRRPRRPPCSFPTPLNRRTGSARREHTAIFRQATEGRERRSLQSRCNPDSTKHDRE